MIRRANPFASLTCLAVMASLVIIATSAPAAARPPARPSNAFVAPQQCQLIEETGQVITIPWESEGCNAARADFRFEIAKRMKFPGWYPPLTCVAGGVRYGWEAPSCAHARNQYADHKIRAIWFGRHPRR
jgi:hypothetical protein